MAAVLECSITLKLGNHGESLRNNYEVESVRIMCSQPFSMSLGITLRGTIPVMY